VPTDIGINNASTAYQSNRLGVAGALARQPGPLRLSVQVPETGLSGGGVVTSVSPVHFQPPLVMGLSLTAPAAPPAPASSARSILPRSTANGLSIWMSAASPLILPSLAYSQWPELAPPVGSLIWPLTVPV
jgi:hypothetical protein